MLKTKTKQIINMQDWDNLVIETYGKPYMFQQQDGCKDRGTEHITVPAINPYDYEDVSDEFDPTEKDPFSCFGGVSFKNWLEIDYIEGEDIDYQRNFYPHVDMIINDLHSKGLLKAGEYYIEIDW